MNDSFRNRFQTRMTAQGLDLEDVARQLNTELAKVNEWLLQSSVPARSLPGLAELLNCAPKWLIHGVVAGNSGIVLSRECGLSASPERVSSKPKTPVGFPESLFVDLLPHITPYTISKQVTGDVVFSHEWLTTHFDNHKHLRLLKNFRPDTELGIKTGDHLLIDTSDNTIKVGKIYILAFDGKYVLRKIIRARPEGGFLISADSNGLMKVVLPDKINGFTVIGRLVYRGSVLF